MDTTEEIANAKTDNENHTEVLPEFTFSDVENLYLSALEIQQKACRKLDGVEINSLPLDLEIELANFIGKLKKWVIPFAASKEKVAKSFDFIQQGNSYAPAIKMDEDELMLKRVSLLTEFEAKNTAAFDHIPELKNLLPLKLFTQARIEEAKVYFKDCVQKQMFLQYCIKQLDKP